jgi:hypothetical protein
VASRDGELWDGVSRLLRARRGWRLEPQTTPGASSTWCFGSGGEADLSVGVDAGSLSVYVIGRDVEIVLPDVDALAAWLDADESVFRGRASLSSDEFDALVLHGLDAWRRPVA